MAQHENGIRSPSLAVSHALVIGGGMAGLLAARVLSAHSARVTIVERDRIPELPGPRKGVPQANHQHVMLKRGMDILERLFPGLRGELVAAGAPLVDMANDLAWLTPFGWGVRFPSDLVMLTCSRDLLEWGVRRRVVELSGVRFLEGGRIVGLLPDPQGDRVAGVKFRTPSAQGERDEEETLRADLIVDASGRFSHAPRWLAAVGYEPPEEQVINARLGYASRLYRIPEGYEPGWKGAYVQLAPPRHTRGGVMLPLEGGRWLLTLSGTGGDYPPTDEAGFLDFARSLRNCIHFDAIKDAEPISAISAFRATENRLRRYDKVSRRPHNFLVLGDAACAFNPVYAQGMTVAAQGAEALEQALGEQARDHPDNRLAGLAGRFQARLARVDAAAWAMATAQDLRVRGVVGRLPRCMDRLMGRYMDRAVARSTESARVRLALLETMNMLALPSSLYHPRIAREILRGRGSRGDRPGRRTSSTGTVPSEALHRDDAGPGHPPMRPDEPISRTR